MILKAEQIQKSFGELEILKNVSLTIEEAEILSIIGASGAGKTSLLQILGTLDRPSSGTLSIAGEDPLSMNNKALAKFRNSQIGFVFQFHQLLPEFTAYENVLLPAMIAKRKTKEIHNRADYLFHQLGVYNRKSHKPSELSGGEQQRIAVCRALMNSPKIIFADEPSGNLDSRNASELHELFFKLREEMKQTFVIVTHNNDLASKADRKLTLQDGTFI